jgi:hypothetical protein
MLLRTCGIGVVFLALAVAASGTRGQDKKDPGKDAKDVVGKIKDVSVEKKFFVIAVDDKTDRTFQVNKDTKFTGPRGSNREDGLQDPCMAKGYEVHVVPADDEKFAKEVKLPLWKADEGKKGKGKKGA